MEYKLGKLIGFGSQGQVYEAMNMDTGEIVAYQQKLDVRCTILIRLKYLFCRFFNIRIQQNTSFMKVQKEFMSMGSISQLLSDFDPIKEQTVKRYTQVFAQKRNIALDLKSSNILLDCNGWVKISDFGCSRQNKENLCQGILQDSVPWMAPEVVRQERIGPASDIWSFGCLILEMITGRPPWSEQINFDNAATSLLSIGLSGEYPRIPETASIEIKELLLMCFQVDPLQRATLRQLKQSGFLQ